MRGIPCFGLLMDREHGNSRNLIGALSNSPLLESFALIKIRPRRPFKAHKLSRARHGQCSELCCFLVL